MQSQNQLIVTSNFLGFGGVAGLNAVTLKISNPSASDKQYTVFGPQNPDGSNRGGVIFDVPESSLGQLTRESQDRAFMIDSAKIVVTDVNQLSEPITITYADVTGSKASYSIQPTNYESPMAGNQRIIEVPGLKIPVTGDVGITGTIKAGVTMTVLLYIKERTSNFTLPKNKRAVPLFWGFPGLITVKAVA